MTVTPYATLAQVKDQLGITDTSRDTRVSRCLDSATTAVDDYTGRGGTIGFHLAATATARTFNPNSSVSWRSDGGLMLVDEIGDTTGLILEEGSGTSWGAVDPSGLTYYPDNATDRGRPVTGILRATFWIVDPYSRVRVTAKWGWPAVPAPVVESTIILAAGLFIRTRSLEGVTGSNDWGAIRLGRLDPNVKQMLDPYIIGGFA